jgi:hypothetical protein
LAFAEYALDTRFINASFGVGHDRKALQERRGKGR